MSRPEIATVAAPRRWPRTLWGRLLVATSSVLATCVAAAVGATLALTGGMSNTVLGIAVAAVLCAVGIAASAALIHRTLRPLREITATAGRLSAHTLHARLGYQGPGTELTELAGAFDHLLDRLAGVLASQKRFVANASHELRTPLAVMRTEIDVTLADPDASDEDLRRMGRVVREASQRANDLIEALLLLARTEAQVGRGPGRRVATDLGAGVTASLRAVEAEVRRLRLTVHCQALPAPVVGDPSLLERLAGNLIENAVRHNVLNGVIEIRSGVTDGRAWLRVGNTGPELNPGEVPGLFEPFRRGGVERTGTRGQGLGLSIVKAVVSAHGGQVSAEPRPGGGLNVSVWMPASMVGP